MPRNMSAIGGYGNPGIFRAETFKKNTGSITRPKVLLVFAEYFVVIFCSESYLVKLFLINIS